MFIRKCCCIFLFIYTVVIELWLPYQLKADNRDVLENTILWIGNDAFDNNEDGSGPKRYFTPEDITKITDFTKSKNKPTYLIFSGFHGANEQYPWIIQNAIALKAKDPNLKICHYFSMHLAHDLMKELFQSWNFNFQDWLLKPDLPSNSSLPQYSVIPYSLTSTIPNIDIANPDYQTWLYGVISNLNQYFDCYAFDNVFSYTRTDYVGSLMRASMLRPYLSDAKLNALENAKYQIFDHLQKTFSDKDFFFNGVAQATWAVNERNLQHLKRPNGTNLVNGVLYEKFCAMQGKKTAGNPWPLIWTADVNDEPIREIYEITKAYPTHKFFTQINYINPDDPAIANFVANACLGQFLLINNKNTYLGAGRYRLREFFKFIENLKLPNTGKPDSEPVFNENGLHFRNYQKGIVVANTKGLVRAFNIPPGTQYVKTTTLNNEDPLAVVSGNIALEPRASYFLSNFQQGLKFKLTQTFNGECTIPEIVIDALGKNDTELYLKLTNFNNEILAFKEITNNWNQAGINNAYRYDVTNGATRYGLALGVGEINNISFPVFINKGVLRLREFTNNTLIRDCRYNLN